MEHMADPPQRPVRLPPASESTVPAPAPGAGVDLLQRLTDVLEEVAAWQVRPLEPVYPLVFFDALRIKVRDEGVVRNKAVHIALGVRADGSKEILGLWLEQNEGAKFWLRVMNELRNRGVEDVLLAVVDGLKGFPDAIRAVFPEALVQTCIVHLLRHSLDFVSYKDRKLVAGALKDIYRESNGPIRAAMGKWRFGNRPRLRQHPLARIMYALSNVFPARADRPSGATDPRSGPAAPARRT